MKKGERNTQKSKEKGQGNTEPNQGEKALIGANTDKRVETIEKERNSYGIQGDNDSKRVEF